MFAWLAEGGPHRTLGMGVTTGSIDGRRAFLEQKNAEGCGIFVLVNESTDPARRAKETIGRVRAVWTDIDAPGDLPPLPLDPSLVVKTPNGWHVYYVLDTPSESIAWGEGMNRTLAARVGGDPAACDAARVLRLPGFYHRKGEPRMVELWEDGGVRYPAADIEDALGAPTSPVVATLAPGRGEGAVCTPYGLAAAARELQSMEACERGVGRRNATLCRSAYKLGQLVGGGELTREYAIKVAGEGAARMGYVHDHGEGSTMASVMSSIRAGEGTPRAAAGEPVREQEAVSGGGTGAIDTVRDAKDGLLQRITAGIDRRIEMGFRPAPSPLTVLNKRLGGGAPAGAVTLIGAPPGMGKSSLALYWASEHARAGQPAVYCSLELSELDLWARLCTLEHSVSWIEVRCGKHREKLLDTVKGGLHVPFYAFDRTQLDTIDKLRQSVCELSQKYGSPPLVVIDYLQLLIPLGETREQWTVMADISAEVAHLAQDSGSPLICITAINRQSYQIADKGSGKPDRYAALAAAKQSGRLEYDAEVIMALQLCEVTAAGQYGWVCIAKNRSGGGADNVGVRYDGLSGRFYDADPEEVIAAMAAEREVNRQGKDEEVAQKIVKQLEAGPTRNVDGLCKAAGVARNRGRALVMKLMDDGVVSRDDSGAISLRRNESYGMERGNWGAD